MEDCVLAVCSVCGGAYWESRRKWAEWGSSGRPFEPTGWLCPSCRGPIFYEPAWWAKEAAPGNSLPAR